MPVDSNLFDPNVYTTTMEYEYSGLINALCYLHQEIEKEGLEAASLHLKIAIAELKEHRLPIAKSSRKKKDKAS